MKKIFLSLATACIISFSVAAQQKTNIIFILADDLGYGDIGAFGANDIHTPNIDNLAKGGLKFTSMYSASPVCSPSRFALLTGRYPRRQGVDGVFFPESFNGIPKEEITIAEALKTKGYVTGIIGKWHLGHHKEYLPLQNGFDEYFGIPYSNDMQGVAYLRGNDVERYNIDQQYITKTYTEEAIKFIDKHKKEPFFLYLPNNMPHVPLYASESFSGKSKRGLYGDVIEEIDWSVGELMAALKRNNIEQNTLVIFSSDNGPWLAFDIEGGSAGPLREGKQTTFEGGQRVPTIAYWPATIKPNTEYAGLATLMDIFPTLMNVAGMKDYKSPNVLDGEDLMPVLTGQGKRKGDEFTYYYNGEIQAFRKGDWKIKFPYKGNHGIVGVKDVEAHDTLLFNLKTDVGERNNVLSSNREKVNELLIALDSFKAKLGKTPATLIQRIPADNTHIRNYFQRHPELKKTF